MEHRSILRCALVVPVVHRPGFLAALGRPMANVAAHNIFGAAFIRPRRPARGSTARSSTAPGHAVGTRAQGWFLPERNRLDESLAFRTYRFYRLAIGSTSPTQSPRRTSRSRLQTHFHRPT